MSGWKNNLFWFIAGAIVMGAIDLGLGLYYFPE